jgi:CRISPR-associated protein Csm2
MTEFNDNRNNERNPRPKIGLSNTSGSYQNKSAQGYKNRDTENATTVFSSLIFKSEWILIGADKELKFMQRRQVNLAQNQLTNSKIRSIYGEIKRIQMGDFEKEKVSFYLLKPKVAYALGRDPKNEG